LFFPDEEFFNTGLGVSLYNGAKFNKYFATDIEIGLLNGGTEESDRTYALTEKKKSVVSDMILMLLIT
jgi:hypothetical protein